MMAHAGGIGVRPATNYTNFHEERAQTFRFVSLLKKIPYNCERRFTDQRGKFVSLLKKRPRRAKNGSLTREANRCNQ
jgi:hypothetical protein